MQQPETGVYFKLITDKLHAKADADLKAHGLTMTQPRVLCFYPTTTEKPLRRKSKNFFP